MFSVEPRQRVLSVKSSVSMTRVSPSQCPRDSPVHDSMPVRGLPSMGMMRESCTISFRMTTVSSVWNTCMFWL